MFDYLVLYPAELLALVAALALILGFKIKPWLGWAVAVIGCGAFAAVSFVQYPLGKDVRIFWETGRTLWEHGNPYGDKCLNPPTAFPFYWLLATLPFPVVLTLWTALTVAGCLVIVALAQRVLRSQDPEGTPTLPPVAIGIFTSAVALSFAVRYGIELGQIAVFMTLCLFAALHAQARGKPTLAGILLAIASIKVSLMLPFLVLFHRRDDRRTWVTFTIIALALCLFCVPAMDLPGSLRTCLVKIGEFGSPGRINDYSYLNSNNIENFGFDHAFYRLGIHDRQALQVIQLTLLAALGAWIGWHIVRGHWPMPAASAIVALYSAIFLYHRVYDMTILCLPLVYCTARAWREHGLSRVLFTMSSFGTLGILYLRVGVLRTLTESVPALDGFAFRMIEAIVLPYGTWLVLVSLFCLAAGERILREPAATRVALARA